MAAEIDLHNVTKRFGHVVAVDNAMLHIPAGETFVLVGPSGCGKTTLLRLIAGLEKPDSGTIRIAGEDVTHVPPRARRLAMVFQQPTLVPHMTIRQNWHFALEASGLAASGKVRRVDEMAMLLGLSECMERRPDELSGGELQRAALGRALVRHPRVCLLDEPLSQLDPTLRSNLRRLLRSFHKQHAMTTVYVTHDQAEAMMMADTLAVMHRGRLLQVGKPQELYHQPGCRQVALLIGQPPMNLFRAKLEPLEHRMTVQCGPVTFAVPRPARVAEDGATWSGTAVDVGIRAEDCHWQVAPSGDPPDRWLGLPGRQVGAWDEGHSRWAEVQVEPLDTILIARCTRADRSLDGQWGIVYLDLYKLHIFRHADGRRLYFDLTHRVDETDSS